VPSSSKPRRRVPSSSKPRRASKRARLNVLSK
jgi:hypothetical protein